MLSLLNLDMDHQVSDGLKRAIHKLLCQKILPSVLDYVEKSACGLPFNPAAQTAKNGGFTIRCEKCQNQAWCIRSSNHREHKE